MAAAKALYKCQQALSEEAVGEDRFISALSICVKNAVIKSDKAIIIHGHGG